MHRLLRRLTLFLLVLCAGEIFAQTLPGSAPAGVAADVRRISLSGEWKFTADYQDCGDRAEWFSPQLAFGASSACG